MARRLLYILAAGVLFGAMPGVAAAEPPVGPALQSAPPAEFVPEGSWSGTDWQVGWETRGEAETGAIPEAVSEEPWMGEYGQD